MKSQTMRAFIIAGALLASGAACAGSFRQSGVIDADTATTVTGVQSNTISTATQPEDLADLITSEGATNAALVSIANVAPTLTVYRAQSATYADSSGYATNAGYAASAAYATYAATADSATTATKLTLADGNWWTSGGTNYIVTPDTNRVYIISASVDFNGPAVGFVFTRSYEFPEVTWWTNGAWMVTDYTVGGFILEDNPPGEYDWEANGASGLLGLPAVFDLTAFASLGSCVIDWGKTTNSYPLASMPDIASHNINGTAHADIRAKIEDAPDWGVTNGLLYLDGGAITGMVFRMGATNIYLWQVQP